MEIDNLIVEVTRRCQLACEHCLRGDAENVNIDPVYLECLLEKVSSIGCFYIATNGIDITHQFINTCIDLYMYCDEPDMCMVNLSNDMYHDIPEKTPLSALSFFATKHPTDYWEYEPIPEGRWDDFSGRKPVPVERLSYDPLSDYFEGDFYLNALGDICGCCDWSYAHQRDFAICNVMNDHWDEQLKKDLT